VFSNLFTRRAFAGRFATLVSGLGLAAAGVVVRSCSAEQKEETGGVKKMDWDGKPAGTGFITPTHHFCGVISHLGARSAFAMTRERRFPRHRQSHQARLWKM